MTSEQQVVAAQLHEYFADMGRAFHADHPGLLSRHYSGPLLLLSPQGTTLMSDAEAIDAFCRQLIANLPADYDHSTVHSIDVRMQNPSIAVASIDGGRYRANGEEIRRLGGTYILTKASGDWKIAVLLGN